MSDMKKQLRIKLGVAKRMHKEYLSYGKEATKQTAKIAKMREEGKDAYDIRKQLEVLAETEAMIPDTRARLDRAREDLEEFVDVNGEDASIADSAMLAEARELLKRRNGGEGGGCGTRARTGGGG